MEVFDQRGIALRQLETALALYEAGEDYFSVITLAGAAEEILEKQLSLKGMASSLEEFNSAAVAMFRLLNGAERDSKVFADRANRARNSLKHKRPDRTIQFDACEEARDMLNRAVDNFWRLESRLTPAMEQSTCQ